MAFRPTLDDPAAAKETLSWLASAMVLGVQTMFLTLPEHIICPSTIDPARAGQVDPVTAATVLDKYNLLVHVLYC